MTVDAGDGIDGDIDKKVPFCTCAERNFFHLQTPGVKYK